MAAEPICIYSRRGDLRGVAALLRQMAPNVRIEGPDDRWTKVVVVGPGGALTFTHNPDLCDDNRDWGRHKHGLTSYLLRFPRPDNGPSFFELIDSFSIAIGTLWDPEHFDDDERDAYLFAVVQHLDGVLFTPSTLFDSHGRILISADGTTDPDAVMPKVPFREPPPADDVISERRPPTPERVARRAMALAAVGSRALLEDDWWWSRGNKHRRLLAWVDDIGIGDELEPDEWSVLQRPPGRLNEREHIDAMWRLEGLVVLAWALGRFPLPSQDRLVKPGRLLWSVGFADAGRARELLASASLRSAEELARTSKILLAIHWRLREYSLRPEKLDFRKFSREGWMGPFDISPIALVEDDLAIENFTISKSLSDSVERTHSAARERHLAMRWLEGDSPIYSKTDTST
jgi:Domain of unknown function (DUF4272)